MGRTPGAKNKPKKAADDRGRNWYTLVYPDSAPEGWQDILADQCVPAFISPLHENDVNPGGEPKKPHWHIMVMFEGKKSEQQVRDLFEMFGGVGCERVNSMRGYGRYLCHLDNPEKAQYDVEEVRALCGADYFATINLPTDKYKSIREMMQFCKANNIISYAELLEYSSEERMDWFRVLCDNGTVVIKEYLKSKSWTFQHQNRISTKVDMNVEQDVPKEEGGDV